MMAITQPGVEGLFDTHCHLDAAEFESDRDQVIDAAYAAGVRAMLVPAVEVANFAAVDAVCRHPASLQKISLNATFGIHPMYTPRALEEDVVVLRRWIVEKSPLAMGEIGLDGYVPNLDMDRQEWFFVEQLKLAREFDLPVLLHIRRAQDRVLKCLRRIRVKGGIAHAFNGSRQQADAFIKLGFKLGVGGAMTYAGSTRIRQLARDLPLENLVLETDAPDIPPAWITGRNTPAQLAMIAESLAEIRQQPILEIAEVTTLTTLSMLGLQLERH